ncbi:hypothetical protein IFM12276_35400 [Nocardia sputorum]|uniref:DUF2007 domain-containing protein n=1 Tax=Nocardia sputorum TaxID=2984338 RepID=A0ABN6U5H4_9NOCA|nr:hypothetical protein IFM12276_35400 [Nocardia sputorum]
MRRRPVRHADDYGLLVPAATVASDYAGHVVRDTLRSNGIRSTVGWTHRRGRRHRLLVLVFPEDAVRAYEVICAHTRPPDPRAGK